MKITFQDQMRDIRGRSGLRGNNDTGLCLVSNTQQLNLKYQNPRRTHFVGNQNSATKSTIYSPASSGLTWRSPVCNFTTLRRISLRIVQIMLSSIHWDNVLPERRRLVSKSSSYMLSYSFRYVIAKYDCRDISVP